MPLNTVELLAFCRAGDQRAADAIFERYLSRLTALARSRLSQRMQARLDAADVVMSAFRSFFIGMRRDGFANHVGDDLWPLLVQITLRKLYRQVARHQSQKRAVQREIPLTLSDGSQLPVPAREPLPEEVATIADELQNLLAQLTPTGGRIVELRLQGVEIPVVAAELQVSARTVKRHLEHARQILLAGIPGRTLKRPVHPRAADLKVSHQARDYLCGEELSAKARSPLFTLDDHDFVLQRMIGAGGVGKVYRALDKRDGKLYALKFLRKTFSRDREAIQRFLDEFSRVARFDHPHLLAVHGCGRTASGNLFFAMSLADGDLQRKIEQSAPSIRQAVDWVCQAACGIDHAHRLGIIHCDLKPSNLLLSPGNTVVISDFGLAGSEFELSARGHFAGTPGFMAPEQIAQGWGDISIRTDVYGLGATLFALLARRPPYIGSRASDVISQVLAASPPIRLAALRPRIPKGLDDICQQCLAKDPSQRFKDVQDLQNTLDRFRD